MDGVFFARSNPSFHYLERIGKRMPVKQPLQLAMLIDTRSKQCMSIRLRTRRKRGFADAKYLLSHSPQLPKTVVADSDYDVESVYKYAKNHNMTAMIPVRKGTRHGFCRNYMRKRFNKRTYHKRSLVEAVFSAIKRRSGSHCLARTAKTQRREIYARILAYNLNLVSLAKIFN